jgi:asparagine synthase (glutamine-hydrolysing)
MCGIVGIVTPEAGSAQSARSAAGALLEASERLRARGPDHGGHFSHGRVALGHRRLVVIDPSPEANQPFTDRTGQLTITYNGEIYNYRELRDELARSGVTFVSHSDTEVLLELYRERGLAALEVVNGVFAFAIYDRRDGSLLLARDRIGVKPLYYCQSDSGFVFASEMKALLAFPVPREIDPVSVYQYLQLSYIPAPHTVFKTVRKLEPGCYLRVTSGDVEAGRYYQVPYDPDRIARSPLSYPAACSELRLRLEAAVRRQLVSDVPLGAYLSGGIDSTIVAMLASRHTEHLKTFSIGFRHHDFYDETEDAVAAAKWLGTEHTVFSLTLDDLYAHMDDVLDYIDEPFADSSALAVYVLSRHTRERVKVALSGDGADELFGGYNKHYAEKLARDGGRAAALATGVAAALVPLWNLLPHSRDSGPANRIRQLRRFALTAGRSERDRYWEWCAFTREETARAILSDEVRAAVDADEGKEYRRRREAAVSAITPGGSLNDVFYADVGLVLDNDMLRKADLMSMANGLEVRVPYLDHELVEFCFQLPADYKIGGRVRKRILRDAFSADLPPRTLRKPKHGFEVPLIDAFRTRLRSSIADDLLEEGFVQAQRVFDPQGIRALKRRLFSPRPGPGDIAPLVWALVVFQHWWKRYAV